MSLESPQSFTAVSINYFPSVHDTDVQDSMRIVGNLEMLNSLANVSSFPLLLISSGAPNNGFLQNTLKTLFSLSRVLLDLQKRIISGATKFASVRSSKGNLSLFEIARALVLSFQKFQVQFNVLRTLEFFLIPFSITFQNPKILGFLFLRKQKQCNLDSKI